MKSRDMKILAFIVLITFTIITRTSHSWDFTCYELNAKHILGQGRYFEVYRPPVLPLLMIPFGLISWTFSSYAVAILAALLYFYAVLEIIKLLKLKAYFALLAVFPAIVFFGILEGTEMLSLSLVLLALVNSMKDRYNGHLLALSFLTRYNMLIFFVFGFRKNWKKTLINFLLILLTLLPWLVANQILWHYPIFSLTDTTALNVYFRSYIHEPTLISNVLKPDFLFETIGFLGIISFFLRKIRNKSKRLFAYQMFFIIVVTLLAYFKVPVKSERYLYNILFPSVFLTYIFIENELSIKAKDVAVAVFSVYFILQAITYIVHIGTDDIKSRDIINDAIKAKTEIINMNLTNCKFSSNAWPYLNYIGVPTKEQVFLRYLNNYLKTGYFIYLPNVRIKYAPFLKNLKEGKYKIVYNSPNVIILGNTTSCKPWDNLEYSYINDLKQTYHNKSFPSLTDITLLRYK